MKVTQHVRMGSLLAMLGAGLLLHSTASAQVMAASTQPAQVHVMEVGPAPVMPRKVGWEINHPLALGVRLSGRVGTYGLGGVGGHIRVRPHKLLTIEAFSDNFFGVVNGQFRHDHEVGTTLQLNVANGDRWSFYPMLGACAVVVMVEPSMPGAPSVTDIQFGVHAGAGFEYYVAPGISLGTKLEAIGYIGHAFDVQRWTASISNDLSFLMVGQAVVDLNFYF